MSLEFFYKLYYLDAYKYIFQLLDLAVCRRRPDTLVYCFSERFIEAPYLGFLTRSLTDN